ncbi:hypothetical protein [Paenibacillus fonticola]|uniref:hypothetical protein n=1 Tax=Paenibacillus fonticola TaxID=379896 RepID=UPI000366AD8F|nr:hypothetical protein [Paenibacillus fonticola]
MYFFEIRQLEDISRGYFEIIEDYFKGIYQPGVDKFFQAEKIGFFQTAAQTILASLDDLEEDLTEFWKKNKSKVIELTSKTDFFKVIYCGSPSPLDGVDFIKRTALYIDSLLIEDPLSFLLRTKQVATDNAYLNQLIKHSFNLLDLKRLFFGDGNIPLLIIFPSLIDDEEKKKVRGVIEKSGDEYFRLLFERDFLDTEDIFDYLSEMKDVDQLLTTIKEPSILFPDILDKKERLIEMYEDIRESWQYKDFSLGSSLGYKIYGQFLNLGTQVFQAHELSSQISFDKKEYWNLYKWDINQAQGMNPDLDSTILNAVQLEEFRWLENLDIDKINLVRNQEELSNIRSVIRKNINITVNGVNEEKVKEQAMKNMEKALIEHSKRLDDYTEKLKKKIPIDTLAVVVGTMTSIPASLSLLPVAGAISTIYGIYDYFINTRQTILGKKQIQNSLMGVLFDANQNSI